MLTIKYFTTYLKRRPFIQFFESEKYNYPQSSTLYNRWVFVIITRHFIILKKNVFITPFFGFKNVRYVSSYFCLILAFDDCCFMMTNVYLPIFKEERNYCWTIHKNINFILINIIFFLELYKVKNRIACIISDK